MIKTLKRAFLLSVGGYLLLVFGLYFFQESLIFLPNKLDKSHVYQFSSKVEEINVENGNVQLNALHFKVKNPKGVILYFHGNAGDLSRWGKIVEPLLRYDYDLIVMDYRGYGKNAGDFSEQAMYSDADAFYEYTKSNYRESEVVVYGRSLGSTFATFVAANNKPSKLILETPFYSVASVAKNKFPFLPIDWLLKYRFETNQMADKVSCPTLVLLSENDEVVGYENGLKLAESFSTAKTVSISEAGHNNQAQFEAYWQELSSFLQE